MRIVTNKFFSVVKYFLHRLVVNEVISLVFTEVFFRSLGSNSRDDYLKIAVEEIAVGKIAINFFET